MQNKEHNSAVPGCHPKKEQVWEHFSCPAGNQLNMGWSNPCVPDRHIWARRAAGSGMGTADGSVPFCPDQNGDKLEQEQLQD